MNSYVLLFVVIVLATSALLQGIFLFADAIGNVSSRIKRRLNDLSAGDPTTSLRRKALGEGAAQWLVNILTSAPFRWLDRLIIASGIKKTTERVLQVMIFGISAAAVSSKLVIGLNLLPSLLVSIAVGVLPPLALLMAMRARRARKIVEQLPETLDMFVRSLRAGHPIPTAIRMIAIEMPDPIGTEFGLAFDAMTYGLDLRDALERMAERVRVPEVQYMVAAIRIQHAAGGNLAEILASLSAIMRERLKLYLKVKALSAESRFSGKILAAMPFGIVGLIYLSNPGFYDGARTDNGLAMILYFAGFLVFLGIFLLRRIVKIRV
jgi:tight adherence protein B